VASIPSSYFGADTALGKRDTRKVANNTYLRRRGDGEIALRLHNTDVVTWTLDTVTLNTGGWTTVTTKARINEALPGGYGVWSDKGRWYLHAREAGTRYAFADGITIHTDTDIVTGFIPETDTELADRERKAIRRKIQTFVKGITPEDIVKAFENPQGDCWFCTGMIPGASDHLESHLEDNYFMLSLARNAVAERGYTSTDTILHIIYATAQAGSVDRLLTDNLSKYLRKHLTSSEGVSVA
jgi:hypothetical protein